jgi:hypothetical protein
MAPWGKFLLSFRLGFDTRHARTQTKGKKKTSPPCSCWLQRLTTIFLCGPKPVSAPRPQLRQRARRRRTNQEPRQTNRETGTCVKGISQGRNGIRTTGGGGRRTDSFVAEIAACPR